MTNFKSAALFAVFGFLLASLTGSLRAAPDNTLGMALMSATVTGGGTLVVGSGVVSVGHPATGTYNIDFDRDLTNCTCTASFGGHGSSISTTAQSFISSNCPFNGPGDPQTRVRVLTTSNGAVTDLFPFQLIVFCPR